jgi:hypothetical protein
VGIGKELASLDSDADNNTMMSLIPSGNNWPHYVGVKCVANHDWSYNGNTFVISTGPDRNP